MTQFSEFWEAGAQERLNTMFGEAITFTRAGVDYAVTARVQRSSAEDFEGEGIGLPGSGGFQDHRHRAGGGPRQRGQPLRGEDPRGGGFEYHAEHDRRAARGPRRR